MRLFIGLFIVLIISSNKIMAQFNYDNSWKKVNALEEKGLPKSALEVANDIYEHAVKDKSAVQQIKALVFQLKYNAAINDSSTLQNLARINQQITTATGAQKAILQSIKAEMLVSYLRHNRYKLYNRTAVAEDDNRDISTWGIDRLNREITATYQASLADRDILQKTAISAFDSIIVKGNTRTIRPTLYDLLAHRALDYYKSGEERISKPANQFELEDPAAFAPAAVFAAHRFTTEDETSLQYRALLILQELIRLHAQQPAALLDVDQERIQYMNQVAVNSDKDELYIKALEQMATTYAALPEVTGILYLQASHYYEKGTSQKEDGAAIKQAKAICEKAIRLAPKTAGGVDCAQILQQIKMPYLELKTEHVNVPALPFRTLVQYKNIHKIYLRLVKVNEPFLQSLRAAQRNYREPNGYWKLVVAQPAVKSWEQTLPDPEDYINHKAEIKIDALPAGQYMLLSSVSPDFKIQNNPMALQLTWVSNISYIENNDRCYALDRTTGKPLAGLKLDILKNTGSYDNEKWVLLQSAVTAKDGSVNIQGQKDTYNFRLHWKGKEDELYLNDYRYYTVNNNEKAPETPKTFLFADRSIYRPGQTIYFKGIVIKKHEGDVLSDALSGFKTTLSLLDANNEKVDSLRLTTNEFGAYSGKFTLPEGLMNGSFRLEDAAGGAYLAFQVEEYKRPKFYVEFDTVKHLFRLGDTVTTTGKALAYAGNNIDGAQVKYRIERRVRFPYPWLCWKIGYPVGSSREIAHGTATTDATGSFTVKFPALADKAVDPATKPVFSYVVYADVTDLNGETRSAEQWVSVGYQSLEIAVVAPERLEAQQLQQVKIFTRNLNGGFEKTTFQVQIKPLEPNKRLLRPRYWEQPDQFVMSEADYVKAFPVDIYKDENKKESWARKAAVIQQSITSDASGKITLPAQALAPGFYELEATAKDKNGELVIQKATFEVLDTKTKELSAPDYLWSYQQEGKVEPGGTGNIWLGTAAKEVYLIETRKHLDEKEVYTTFTLPALKKLEYAVTEKDRGGIQLSYVFVKDNRVFTVNESVQIPWDNKSLAIKLGTHRNQLLPGEKEKWTLQIAGLKGDKVAAEMLASMYDASLDAFVPHQWTVPDIYPVTQAARPLAGTENFSMVTSQFRYEQDATSAVPVEYRSYDVLNLFGWQMDGDGRNKMLRIRGAAGGAPVAAHAEMRLAKESAVQAADVVTTGYVPPAAAPLQEEEKAPAKQPENAPMTVRKNFQETAFFFPDLRTDAAGNVTFEFTMPEALTKWNFQSIAHTKDLSFGYTGTSIVTQKKLMVQPNAPRFVREGDKMDFTAKVSNLADTLLIGQARLELLDAATMQPVDGWFQNVFPVQHFTVKAGQSTAVTFPIQIPHGFGSALIFRVVAQAGNFSDGEENALPVLTNAMLVTESLPLPVRGDGTKTFKFDKLINSGSSQTLRQHALTVEYTSNPAWYAVQALPYLMEYPYDCAEQVFNRYYANALATHITAATPGIKAVFEKWKTADTAALLSNLQKNEELKAVLLQQTPWVLEAKNEAQQKKNIALLFDLQRMERERKTALDQLAAKQLPNGAFPWFTGMWEDRFITQYILAGIGHLQHLAKTDDAVALTIANKAIDYLDRKLDKDYYDLIKNKADLKKQQISEIQIHYLYARSFFNHPVPAAMKKSFDYFNGQQQQYWLKQSRYAQGMIALTRHKSGDEVTPKAILKSLKENAMNSPEMGMYWKDIAGGYGWHQAPIETQALMVEAFEVAGKDAAAVADLKTWLLKNKQTNNWHTTKATADACYALLLQGSNWIATNPQVTLQLGSEVIKPAATEAGTGYFKERIDAKSVKTDMGNISVTVTDSKGQPTWGAVYWQYFEQLDKITAAKTPLVLEKELFKEENSNKGPVLTKVTTENELKVGDKVKVRIILRADRSMEYIHLKDMRAACFEPVNVLSSAKWQGGLSYYESTKDASTDFFFSYLPKGTHVFEYTLFVTHEGKFSNGISTAQCMYAPEFSAHSEGLNVKVVK
ncbi:alpha-2-macroglobulin family protein [Chitinophaga nivalis]|uniref:MG2 domain-containing protein n=1 Tax=Chitinophaga nivalis TaxID=2991709 RepID=A0ABT3IWP1_9BACT|nr:alpha-2-macroglobulin family protein [Chitinophaga nivalis]MCW3461931.1 MG2 domain-containing protein [Chitinophaga nivalis]MCW3488378.1 MG2 domain-containing protein [Chitinophaga nivalis]